MKSNSQAYAEWLDQKDNPHYVAIWIQRIKQILRFIAFVFQSPRWAQAPAYAAQALTHYQTYPQRPPRADPPPKKACNLDPMAPRSRKKRQLPEAPQES